MYLLCDPSVPSYSLRTAKEKLGTKMTGMTKAVLYIHVLFSDFSLVFIVLERMNH